MRVGPLKLAAFTATYLSPANSLRLMRSGGIDLLENLVRESPLEQRTEAEEMAVDLATYEFGAVFIGDELYPSQLLDLKRPPAVLFFRGNLALLQRAGVGMCGSRHASEAGLRAARACGLAVARAGLSVISGNARGVDTAAHRAALDASGSTVLVLAEGALRFTPKRELRVAAEGSEVIVLSQFAPRATWNVGNAMTRNGLIAALGEALVVIEAGAEGGTLDAGLQGLALGRPVIALEFESGPTPPGNRILHGKGAMAVRSPASLTELLSHVRSNWERTHQLALPLAPRT